MSGSHIVVGTAFTKSLTCLSRYGDDIVIRARPDALFLTATNSSKSAFCRVKLMSEFFNKYKVTTSTPPRTQPSNLEDDGTITGQLFVKVTHLRFQRSFQG